MPEPEFREHFVAALDAYRDAEDDPEYWNQYWVSLNAAARECEVALNVAAQFLQMEEIERHHVALDLLGRVAEENPEARNECFQLVSDAIHYGMEAELAGSVVSSLGATRSPEAVPFLLGCLDSEQTNLRINAVIALALCAENSEVAAKAVEMAKQDRDSEVRLWAEKVQ